MESLGKVLTAILLMVLIVGVLVFYERKSEERLVGLNVHYYRPKIEELTFGALSLVGKPGETPVTANQINMDVVGENTGEGLIENMQIVDAEVRDAENIEIPYVYVSGVQKTFKDTFPSTYQTLNSLEAKTLWTSELIDTAPLESYSQPVKFWVQVEGKYSQRTLYSESELELDINSEAELYYTELEFLLFHIPS